MHVLIKEKTKIYIYFLCVVDETRSGKCPEFEICVAGVARQIWVLHGKFWRARHVIYTQGVKRSSLFNPCYFFVTSSSTFISPFSQNFSIEPGEQLVFINFSPLLDRRQARLRIPDPINPADRRLGICAEVERRFLPVRSERGEGALGWDSVRSSIALLPRYIKTEPRASLSLSFSLSLPFSLFGVSGSSGERAVHLNVLLR